MNILLVGHQGYLGRGLHEYLTPRHRVVGWDQQEDLFSLSAEHVQAQGCDAVINLAVAADRAVARFQIDTPTDRVNVCGARHIARVLKGSDVHWIQLSTREVLGPVYTEDDVTLTDQGYRPRFLVDEGYPYAPANSYAKAKLAAEFISESHARTTVIRLTTGYTDYSHPAAGNWIVSLTQAVAGGRPVALTRDGQQFRDPLHTDDLGALIEAVVEKEIVGETLHAGGGEENLISLREFVTIADPNVAIESKPGGDWGFAFDNAKATRLCKWRPRVSVREKIPVIMTNVRDQVSGAAPPEPGSGEPG